MTPNGPRPTIGWTTDDDMAWIFYLAGATNGPTPYGAIARHWHRLGQTDQHTHWHTRPTIGTDEEEM
jgi:tryptophan synthase beta subunit